MTTVPHTTQRARNDGPCCHNERHNERLEQVAATIFQDLRSPISVADGNAVVLADDIATEQPGPRDRERVSEPLQQVWEAHDRTTESIEDVLALAREGQAVEETQPVSLETVATDAWPHVETGDAVDRRGPRPRRRPEHAADAARYPFRSVSTWPAGVAWRYQIS